MEMEVSFTISNLGLKKKKKEKEKDILTYFLLENMYINIKEILSMNVSAVFITVACQNQRLGISPRRI